MSAALDAGRRLFCDWKHATVLAALLLIFDTLFSCIVLWRVPYTEIDWLAYMDEVEGWTVHGETDYKQLRGSTGPLVYPAGFMYVFEGLRRITGGGRTAESVWLAQCIFVGIYMITQAVVMRCYVDAKVGAPWMMALLVVSKRIHSLYFLRLFNDCVEVMFVHIAILLFMKRKWWLGLLVYSAALSIKMNALLFLPGILYLLARNVGLWKTFCGVVLLLGTQAIIGLPFLWTHPRSYLSKAFELDRVFFHTWTVNLKFLPEEIFTSPFLAKALLVCHVVFLVGFAAVKWSSVGGGLRTVLMQVGVFPQFQHRNDVNSADSKVRHSLRGDAAAGDSGSNSNNTSMVRRWFVGAFQDSNAYILQVLYISNFIGIAFARTLHYQFYTWYFHTLPLLFAIARLPWYISLGCLACIEYAFNVGDATGAGSTISSLLLQAAHFAILTALAVQADLNPRVKQRTE